MGVLPNYPAFETADRTVAGETAGLLSRGVSVRSASVDEKMEKQRHYGGG